MIRFEQSITIPYLYGKDNKTFTKSFVYPDVYFFDTLSNFFTQGRTMWILSFIKKRTIQ